MQSSEDSQTTKVSKMKCEKVRGKGKKGWEMWTNG